jgi:decaprenyl-phosphate phosphoribosyltransferase
MQERSAVLFANPNELHGLLTLLRPSQWIKNGFVLAPLIFSGQLLNIDSIYKTLVTTVLFCLASSAAYVLNDLHDIEQDRMHPIKSKLRPLAHGMVRLRAAQCLLCIIYIILLSAGWFLPSIMFVIAGYISLNIAYTYFLKYQPVIDLFAIALGFVFRVYAGAVAIAVPLSSWMLITVLCLALYLAAVKRRQELNLHGYGSRKVLGCYTLALIDRYAEMAATCALIFYSMYVFSSNPALVITIPVVLFGLFRYQYVVESLHGGESPTDALLLDLPLLLSVFLWIVISIWVMY